MNCDILIYTADGTSFKVDSNTLNKLGITVTPDSQITLDQLAQAVQQLTDGEKTQLFNEIENYNKQGYQPFKGPDENGKILIPNSSTTNLRELYPELSWVAVDEAPDNILLVKKLSVNGYKMWGRFIDTNGKELFVVEDSKEGVQRYINYLKVRSGIKTYIENEDNKKEVDQLGKFIEVLKSNKKTRFSYKSPEQLLSAFINNPEQFRRMPIMQISSQLEIGKGPYRDIFGELYDISRSIRDYDIKRIYVNDVDNILASRLKWNFNTNTYELSLDAAKQAIQIYCAEHNLNEEAEKGFIEGLSNPETATKVLSKITSELSFKVDSVYKNTLIGASSKTVDLANDYGFTYQTITDYAHPVTSEEDSRVVNGKYRGYNIYKILDENGKIRGYVYDLNELTIATSTKLQTDLNKIIQNIDRRISTNDTVENSSYYQTMFSDPDDPNYIVETRRKANEGSLISSLDLQLDQSTVIQKEVYKGEARNPLSFKESEFFDYYNNLLNRSLENDLDTQTKRAAFIYLLNQTDRANLTSQDIDNILTKIKNAPVVYFYVQKAFTYKKGGKIVNVLNLIKTDKTQVVEQNHMPAPVYGLINTIGDVMSAKFGLKQHVRTSQEIYDEIYKIAFEQYKEEYSENKAKQLAAQSADAASQAKAFVFNGEVYINASNASSEDALHEYAHLFLGVLKAQDFDAYMKLMQRVVNTTKGINTKEFIRKSYPYLADSDLNEEVFAKLFGQYLSGHQKDSTFMEVEQNIDDKMKSIFKGNVSDLTRRSLEDVFLNFSRQIGNLNKNDLDFSKGKFYRKAANYIAEQIKNEQIKERC